MVWFSVDHSHSIFCGHASDKRGRRQVEENKNIKKAIPQARLIEAAPDLVGLSDIADILGYSRQNIRKLMMNNLVSFPTPLHQGKTILWHLSSILRWVKESNRYEIDGLLLDIASTNMQLNIAKETVHLDAAIHEQFLAGI